MIQSLEAEEAGARHIYFYDVIFHRSGPGAFSVGCGCLPQCRRGLQCKFSPGVTIEHPTIRIHPHTNGDHPTLSSRRRADNAPYGGAHYTFTLVQAIERKIREEDENNDLSQLDVFGVVQYLGLPEAEVMTEVTRIKSLQVMDDINGRITLELGRDSLFTGSGIGSRQLDLLVVGGDMLGDLTVGSGVLYDLQVEGNLGSPFEPIAIKTRGDIEFIRAGAVHADILPGNVGGPKKRLRYLETLPVGILTGDFIGTIDASEVGEGATAFDGLLIKGNFGSASTPSIVKVEEPLGAANDHMIVRIGGGFYSPTPGNPNPNDFYSRFELPQNGLVGRVVINAEDADAGWGPDARIEVASGGMNPWILDEQRYEIPRGFVGGGLAGLAPFVEYDRDSKGLTSSPLVVRQFPELCDIGNPGGTLDPEECQCQTVNPGSVNLRFYGGVEQAFPQDNGAPVAIWSNEDNNGGLSNLEDITHNSPSPSVTEDGRTWLKITRTSGAWDAVSLYRIRHWHDEDVQHGQTNGGLRCQDVTGQPPQPLMSPSA